MLLNCDRVQELPGKISEFICEKYQIKLLFCQKVVFCSLPLGISFIADVVFPTSPMMNKTQSKMKNKEKQFFFHRHSAPDNGIKVLV